jgi:hypothetical protein
LYSHQRTGRVKVIVNCGPSREFIASCFASLKGQSVSEWEAYVTIDPYCDGTLERAIEASSGDERILITANEERMYSMANLVGAIDRSQAQPEDIIVVLDGDDWLCNDDALQIIVDTYRKYDCWMTYGSWVSNVEHIVGGLPAYEEGTTDFRNEEWLATAVRTWKKWLWDLIDDQDLRDERGEYLRVAEDVAVMFPMLEMSGTGKAKHIPQTLMLYNRANPACVGNINRPALERLAAYVRHKPRYAALTVKPLSQVTLSHIASAPSQSVQP